MKIRFLSLQRQLFGVLGAVLLLSCISSTQNFTTTETRTELVTEACAGIDRTELSSAEAREGYEALVNNLNSYFGFTSTSFIQNLVAGNSTAASEEFQEQQRGAWVVFYIPFLAGLLITIIIWPFLICCCACDCCCGCCCKPDPNGYDKSQIRWPGIVLLVLMVLVVTATIVGMVLVAGRSREVSDRVQCSVHIIPDDIINGNVTADSSNFFSGLQTLSDQLVVLNNSLNEINGNLSQVSNASLASTQSIMNQSRTTVGNIPDGSGG